MGLQYNTKMPRAHLRYFFFTLAVAAVAAAFAARAVGTARTPERSASFLPASVLPAIDRGVARRLVACAGHRREAVVRESMRRSTVALDRVGPVRHALHRRPRHREVPRRHVDAASRHGRARPRDVRCRDRDGVRTTIIREFRRRPHRSGRGPGGGGRGAAAAPRRRVRAGGVPHAHRRSCPTTATTRSCSGTCRSSTSSARGTSSRPPGRRSPSPCSTPASRTRTRPCGFTPTRFAMTTASCYPALGELDAQLRAAAPELGPASRFVAPRDFIWNDNRAARSRRPRHARQRHDRTADQQQRRHGRRGLQREDHAGQGDRQHVGRHLRRAEPAAPTTSWRAGSGTRPTTAPRSST